MCQDLSQQQQAMTSHPRGKQLSYPPSRVRVLRAHKPQSKESERESTVGQDTTNN